MVILLTAQNIDKMKFVFLQILIYLKKIITIFVIHVQK